MHFGDLSDCCGTQSLSPAFQFSSKDADQLRPALGFVTQFKLHEDFQQRVQFYWAQSQRHNGRWSQLRRRRTRLQVSAWQVCEYVHKERRGRLWRAPLQLLLLLLLSLRQSHLSSRPLQGFFFLGRREVKRPVWGFAPTTASATCSAGAELIASDNRPTVSTVSPLKKKKKKKFSCGGCFFSPEDSYLCWPFAF